MKYNDISIHGVTASEKVYRNLRNIKYSKLVETNTLKLSYIPYEISKILSIAIGISIKTFKKTQLEKGCKVNIIGFRNIDIDYLSDDPDKEVHQLNYKIPFSTEMVYRNDDISVKNVYAPVDKLNLKIIDPKKLELTTRLYIAPLVL
ncbi:DUF3794 domain-containing protein [Clostridium lundense]|uniref:DUF3794 domain-containing protein n=1 Tax=Clostridium lundense TaxID=319475 RepID=UPI000486793B|nr:DUF3794 domain-containing protein [Clostridium lundense]